MTKSIKIKNKKYGKKLLALLLSILTIFSCFAAMPFNAFASKETYAGHELHYVDGKDAYCIQYGKISDETFKKDADAVKYYLNTLTGGQRNKINNIIRSASLLGYVNSGDKAKFGAVQKAIWEVTGANTTWNDTVNGYYNTLKEKTGTWSKDITTSYIPSFAGGKYKLEVGKSKTIKDSNGVYDDYWKVSSKAGMIKATVTTGSVANTLVLKTNKEIDYSEMNTFEISSKFKIADKITNDNAKNYVGKMGSQNVIVAPDLNYIVKSVGVYATDVDMGSIQLYKEDSSGNPMQDIQFTCTDKNGVSYPYKSTYDGTRYDGKLVFNELPVSGNPYTIHEIVPDGYSAVANDIQINVKADDIVTASNNGTTKWINEPLRGNLVIQKYFENSSTAYAGATFTLTNFGDTTLTGTTNSNGYLEFTNVISGWYTLYEEPNNANVLGWQHGDAYIWNGSGYDLVKDYNYGMSVYIPPNDTLYFTDSNSIINYAKRGDLRVHKTEEIATDSYQGGQYQNGNNFEITITSRASDNVMGVDLTYVQRTSSDGYAYFCDIPVGTYTVSETNLDSKFVQPASQTVYVDWDGNTSYDVSGNTGFRNVAGYFNPNGKTISFTNILKKFNVSVEKVDSETNKRAQGNSTLAGAVYELYKGDTLVGTYTTDSNGSFTTEYFVCGNDYVLKEKTASEGYQLDTTEYKITEGPEKYTVEFNNAKMTVKEDIIKGQIQLFKYTDDNDESEINPVEPNAEFEIYLKSSGGYDNCYESERDYLVTDENGIATSKALPYGTYVVHQTKGTEGYIFVDDFEVFIDTNGKVYRYFHIENHVTELYLKVVKKDAETGKVIPYNEAQGAMFQILDKDGNVVKLKYTYPEVETIDTFTINSQGYLMLPEKLKYGKYYLVEVQSPYGYYNKNYDVNDPKITAVTDENGNTTYEYDFNDVYKIPFNISENDTQIDKIETGSDVESEIRYVTVDVYNQNQMGVINITKQGEVFSSVTKLGDTYTPQYEVRGLAGAEYTITAKEDIVTPDGTVRYHKGDVVDVITTDSNGVATSKQLYLGEYTVTETKAPHGYVNNGEAQDVTLTYKGQQYSLIDTSATFNNERQKCSIDGTKSIEKDKLYDIGNNGEIENIKFGLFASQEMKATDGKVIPKDGLIEAVYVTSDGKIEFTADLPVDYKYYVKEISTDEHYKLDSTKYEINFTYQGEKVSKVDLKINNGKTINNSIIRGDIVGNKVDEAGRNLYGAKFGLFKSDETEFIEKNAYLVSASAKDGHFEFKDVPYGNYQIKELSAPENYIYSEEPIIVSVEKDKQEINLGDIENILAKGTIEIEKTGEVFSSVVENEDGTFTPVYTKENLEDVTFDVIAAEDIYSYFGDKLVSKGDVVDTVTTDKNGVARTTELYFGKYYVVEKGTLEGFVLDDTKHEVDLHYIDNDTPIVVETLSLENTRQKAEISLTKEMEKDTIFNLGNNNEIANVVFALFAGEDLTATDGSVIEKDSILETATTDENGHIAFKTDVPYGYKYYVKELTTDKHYSLFNDEIKFEFTTDDNSSSLIEIKINDGKVIINELLRGKIVGHKTDENGKNLAGATFGLFYADETEFTEDNAILTAVSDENGVFYFEYVDYGDYIVREIKAPEGYVLNEQSFNVSITKHEQEVNIDCSNKLIRGSVLINKIDSEYPENTLSGAEFCMYEDINKNGILDANEAVLTTIPEVSKGVYRLDNVPYGYYLIKETKAPIGFSLDENIYPLYISENGATYEIKNNGQCFIDNALTGSLKIIKTSSDKNVEGFEFLIEGTSDSGIPVSMVVKTNKDGVIDITPLRTGTYTITELENDLTDRYVLPEAQTITINANETTEVKFFNRVKQGTIVITKTDVATGKVIPFCKIEILDEDGNVVAQGVTDENGVVEFLLDYGTYYYREYEAPEGYILDETMHKFEISEDGQVIKAEMTNEAEATSPKTGTEIAAIGLTVIISSIALGTYLMYLKKRKKSTDK